MSPGLMHKNETGVLLYVDDAAAAMLGFTPEEMVGRRSTEFMHPEDHDQALGSWVRLLSSPGTSSSLRVRHSTAAGQWIWVDITNHNLLHDDARRIVVTEIVPIDAPPDDRTWVSGQLMRRLAEALPLGVVHFDRQRRVVFSNQRLNTMLGRPMSRDLDSGFRDVVESDRTALDRAIDGVLGGDETDLEISLTHPDLGQRRCSIMLNALTDRSGGIVSGALLCMSDITQEAHRREEMRRRAAYDGLTRCFNRVSIADALQDALSACTPDRRTGVAVIYLDVDHLKRVNDELGHAAGDKLLQAVATRIGDAVRDADTVGRLGGDEFLIVSPRVESPEVALQLAIRVTTALRQPLDLGSQVIEPTASIGVAWTADPTENADALVARADDAMYRSKKLRRGEPVLAGNTLAVTGSRTDAHATP
jgi:diguanylate cyclase (GGDEF)-like protein/PAS domain S-box-containing protein